MSAVSRPSSVASHRPLSRVSNRPQSRPQSRHSHHPSSRLSMRILPQCRRLVTILIGETDAEEDSYKKAINIVLGKIDDVNKQGENIDMRTALMHLQGFSRKARIHSDDELAEALRICSNRLKVDSGKHEVLDDEISRSRLPDHLNFLLVLSSPPSVQTTEYASQFLRLYNNPQQSADGLTWAEILKEEPFSGQHWEGACGLQPGSITGVEAMTDASTSPSLSPISDDDSRSEILAVHESDDSDTIPSEYEKDSTSYLDSLRSKPFNIHQTTSDSLSLREDLEILLKRQYWRKDWQVSTRITTEFNLGNPSSLRPSFDKEVSRAGGTYLSEMSPKTYILEHDAVREVLIALQGRSNLLFCAPENNENSPRFVVSSAAPALLHLTPAAQNSIYTSFTQLSSWLYQLRLFTSSVISRATRIIDGPPLCQTVEAFAESIQAQLIHVDEWLAQEEEKMLRSHLVNGRGTVFSLLSLEKKFRDDFASSFEELVRILDTLLPGSAWSYEEGISFHVQHSPSRFSSRLLDELFNTIQSRHSYGDQVTASFILQTFLKTAEPIWQMLGRWLKDGIFMQENKSVVSDSTSLPPEFFIESNDVPFTDPDFWTEGYCLRSMSFDESISNLYAGVPAFLRPLADDILSAGKSIGLLRILGHYARLDLGKSLLTSGQWPTFHSFMSATDESMEAQSKGTNRSTTTSIYSADLLSLVLSSHLLPVCSKAGEILHEVLLVDCNLMDHLQAFEDLYLLRRSDVMSDFCDILYSAIDNRKVWTDFHFLNTAFRDASNLPKGIAWIDSSFVQMSYKAERNSSQSRSVRTLNGITLTYSPPYPLAYIFDDHASYTYNAIFIFLLQIKRAKVSLDNILMRASFSQSLRSHHDLKFFYATRGKLSWFVNTLLAFLCSHGTQVSIERFHKELKNVTSLDKLIVEHQRHLSRLWKVCLLDEKMASIHKAILSILDMSVSFSERFTAFAGDTTLSISRISGTRAKKHRSRRLRRESRNIVSYDQIPSFLEDETESSESELDESILHQEHEELHSLAEQSISESDDIVSQNDRMSKDLDRLVRYIRREVEHFALSEELPLLDVLAFSLQDWDL